MKNKVAIWVTGLIKEKTIYLEVGDNYVEVPMYIYTYFSGAIIL